MIDILGKYTIHDFLNGCHGTEECHFLSWGKILFQNIRCASQYNTFGYHRQCFVSLFTELQCFFRTILLSTPHDRIFEYALENTVLVEKARVYKIHHGVKFTQVILDWRACE